MSETIETGAKTRPNRRLKQADRMILIARAAAELFAEKGFHETGTRDLARATGVSEALIFRYFPSKEILWKAALDACRENAVAQTMRALPEATASTSSLVKLTVAAAESFIAEDSDASRNRNVISRMVLRSLAGDGKFAFMVRSDLSRLLALYIASCLSAAKLAGDVELGDDDDIELLASNYTSPMFMAGAWRLHDAGNDGDPRVLVGQIVRAQLRSVGMPNGVIKRELARLEAS